MWDKDIGCGGTHEGRATRKIASNEPLFSKRDFPMKKTIIALAAVALSAGTAPAAFAQSSGTEVAKDGSCPSGFKASGSSCKSSSGAVAITRIGSCPSGFKSSGNYCVGSKGDYAEVRRGSCPSGLKASQKYCVK